jgi:hypothetical protein
LKSSLKLKTVVSSRFYLQLNRDFQCIAELCTFLVVLFHLSRRNPLWLYTSLVSRDLKWNEKRKQFIYRPFHPWILCSNLPVRRITGNDKDCRIYLFNFAYNYTVKQHTQPFLFNPKTCKLQRPCFNMHESENMHPWSLT